MMPYSPTTEEELEGYKKLGEWMENGVKGAYRGAAQKLGKFLNQHCVNYRFGVAKREYAIAQKQSQEAYGQYQQALEGIQIELDKKAQELTSNETLEELRKGLEAQKLSGARAFFEPIASFFSKRIGGGQFHQNVSCRNKALEQINMMLDAGNARGSGAAAHELAGLLEGMDPKSPVVERYIEVAQSRVNLFNMGVAVTHYVDQRRRNPEINPLDILQNRDALPPVVRTALEAGENFSTADFRKKQLEEKLDAVQGQAQEVNQKTSDLVVPFSRFIKGLGEGKGIRAVPAIERGLEFVNALRKDGRNRLNA